MVTAPRVLLVEDEFLIQELAEVWLEESGFAVAAANNGSDAIAMLEAAVADYRAVITDIHLGRGPTGWDVARRARELHEDMPIIFITGGNQHEWHSKGVPHSVLVLKPFASAQLVTAVAQLLNAGET